MIPAGGTHIRHPETARAARLLGIDYSDAVTGFSFRGRHGNAIVTGAVVASEYLEAVQGVLEAFEDQVVQEEETQRGLEALRLWRKFLAGLRIRERIGGYEIEGEREIEDQMRGKEGEEEEGGFLLDENSMGPTSGTGSEACFPGSEDEEGGGFLPEDTDYVHEDVSGGGFITEDTANRNQSVMVGQDVNPLPAKRQNKKLRDQDTRGGFLSPEHSPHEKDEARIKDLEHNSSIGGMGTDIETHEPNPKAHNTKRYTITLNNRTPVPIAPNPLESLTPPLPPSISPDLSATEIAEALLLQQLHESAAVETMAPSYAEPGAGTLETGGTSAFGNWMGKGDSEINVEKSLAPKGIQGSSVPEEFKGGSAHEGAEKSSALKEAVTMPSVGGTLEDEPVENGKGNENIRESEDEEEDDDGDDDDAGSLLSHDPSDEDADPEWLA